MTDDDLRQVKIRNVKYEELEQFKKIQQEHLDNWMFTNLQNQFNQYTSLFIAAWINHSMCGTVYGCDYDEQTITFQVIAVLHRYWRQEDGSRLLDCFERKVERIKITVGVAPMEFVEKFF